MQGVFQIGRAISSSNIVTGATEGIINRSYSLVPGVVLLMPAIAIGSRAFKASSETSLAKRVCYATTAVILGGLAVLNIGSYLFQANCIGKEINRCTNEITLQGSDTKW